MKKPVTHGKCFISNSEFHHSCFSVQWRKTHSAVRNIEILFVKMLYRGTACCLSSGVLHQGWPWSWMWSAEFVHLFAVEVWASLWDDRGGGPTASAAEQIWTGIAQIGPGRLQVWHLSCDRWQVNISHPCAVHRLACLAGLWRCRKWSEMPRGPRKHAEANCDEKAMRSAEEGRKATLSETWIQHLYHIFCRAAGFFTW